MTEKERQRLLLLEDKHKQTEKQLRDVKRLLEANTVATINIQRTLDELTGAKKFLVWFTSFIVGVGIIIATVLGFHKK